MANAAHLELLKQGVEKWNEWRIAHPELTPELTDRKSWIDWREAHPELCIDLSGAELGGAVLSGANLRGVNLSRANLTKADLKESDLSFANLSGADLNHADIFYANLEFCDLSHAELEGASLWGASLYAAMLDRANMSYCVLNKADLRFALLRETNLTGAGLAETNLSQASLRGAILNHAELNGADLTKCNVFGISAWKLTLDGAIQHDLDIADYNEPAITVDNLEVAQFIYLLLNNQKVRDVINTVTSKAVLILGRFAEPERKAVVDGLRVKLRDFDLLPIVFDFDRPTDKDYTETIQTLAGMSMFVIADLTSPKSTPLELEATVKQFKIPYVPIIDVSVDPRPFAMLVDSQKSFHWVLKTLAYKSKEDLLDDGNLKTFIIDRAMAKREELRQSKNEEPEMIVLPERAVSPNPTS